MDEESLTDQQKAYGLYLKYTPVQDIAEEVGRGRSTIYFWISEGAWREKREAQEEQASAEIEKENLEWRTRLAEPLLEEATRIIRELSRSRTRDLANTGRALESVVKSLALLLGKPTEIIREEVAEEQYAEFTMQNLLLATRPGSDINLDPHKLNLFMLAMRLPGKEVPHLVKAIGGLPQNEVEAIYREVKSLEEPRDKSERIGQLMG